MIEYDHISYMEDIAIRLKDIAHTSTSKKFHRVSNLIALEEFVNTGAGKTPGIHLLVKDVFSSRKGYNLGSVRERQFYTYYLLKYAKGVDYDDKEAIKRELRDTERKIYAKYKKDYYNDIHETTTYGLGQLDLNSFQTEEMALVATGFVGIMVTFSNEPFLDIRYDVNDWKDVS